VDLKVNDVAELLNISEDAIYELLSEGKIPAYKIGGEYRFDPLDIESWISQRKDPVTLERIRETLGKKLGSLTFSLFRAIYRGSVFEDIKGKDKKEIINEAVRRFSKDLDMDADVLTVLLTDREQLMSTAIGEGVAIPHTRDFLIDKPYDMVSLVYPQIPIEYGALDGKKVHSLFFLFARDNKNHLHLLAKIAHFCRAKESIEFLMQKPNKKELLNFVKQWETKINLS